MKRLFIIVPLLASPAFAEQPLTDNEIVQGRSICELHVRARVPKQTATYMPGWENCSDIEVEYQKRQLDKHAKDAEDKNNLDALIGRLHK